MTNEGNQATVNLQPETVEVLEDRIFDLQRVLRRIAVASAGQNGPGLALQAVMRQIDELGESRARDLCCSLGVSAPVLSRHIADLEDRSLVTRRRHPVDGRAQLITLTDQGKTALRDYEQRRSVLLQGALQDWSEADTGSASVIMERLSQTLNNFLQAHA